MQSEKKPVVAVGSCLVGEPVRFNGEHKRRNPHIEHLKDHLELIPICPEVGIGLGVPRETIRLVEVGGEMRARDSKTQQNDVTDALQGYADRQQKEMPQLCGYILVKGSPSCGMERVAYYNERGNKVASDQSGIYARRLLENDPLLPVEEDGRLHDHALRESFVSRVYLYSRWKSLLAEDLTFSRLVNFYADYKYLVMAHSVPIYQQLGPLLANGKQKELDELADEVIHLMMTAFKKVVTPGQQANVLQHIQGYLKNKLSAEEKRSLQQLIDQYRKGIVPLIAPMTLLKHHFERSPDPYIERQVFMRPYPDELALRSHLY
ncbi:DUF523 and DUF1722 domain-containing protein [Proteobacteria bacterium 005FR1]|nr:DUF523 and DUF1722 domain-containing protein [Proteobacteria bacterium 005FR1]